MGKAKDVVYVTDRMRALCSRREYCTSDLKKKVLLTLEGNAEATAEVMQTLLDEKYIDDARYASAYARDKSGISGWGAAKIRYMLSAKGIARQVIDAALQEIDQSRADIRLEKLLENKYRSLKNDPQCRMKLLRFALGRGYSYDEASQVIGKMIEVCD